MDKSDKEMTTRVPGPEVPRDVSAMDSSIGARPNPELMKEMTPPVRPHMGWYIAGAVLLTALIWVAHLFFY
jgi:hypothetical protein